MHRSGFDDASAGLVAERDGTEPERNRPQPLVAATRHWLDGLLVGRPAPAAERSVLRSYRGIRADPAWASEAEAS